MKTFATPDRKRLQRKSQFRPAGPSPSLLGQQSRRAIREILDGPGRRGDGLETRTAGMARPWSGEVRARLRVRAPGFAAEQAIDPRGDTSVALPGRQGCGKRAIQNLDSEELARGARKRINEQEPPAANDGPEAQQRQPATAPSCRYKTVTVSERDAWQDFPATSGGGRRGGTLVSPNADWVAGKGIMVERFLLTIDVDGDPNLCRYKQENKHRVARRAGTATEIVDGDQARHDDTYPRTSSWIRFVDSKIQWMDAPGYAANLDATDPPVHQKWTFWYSAWDSDGTGPLELQLSYDFKAPDAGNTWSITYTPGIPNSVSR